MKHLNKLNRVLFWVLCIVFLGTIVKFLIVEPYDRYNYYASAFTPREFPVKVYDITFKPYLETPSFYESEEDINSLYSYWGKEQSSYGMKIQGMLPKTLLVEYIDFRTKKYYCEEIPLPRKAIKEAIEKVNKNDKDRDRRDDDALQIKVGIANEGHIVLWMAGKSYQTKFFHTQIHPKPLPNKLVCCDYFIKDKEDFIKNEFNHIPDSIQQKILSQKVEHIQYKDSIPEQHRYW